MATFEVPYDIVELVIDEISLSKEFRMSALKACALTCRAFLKPSQHCLFRSVSFTYFDHRGFEKYLCFMDALNMSPEHALNVREFRVEDSVDTLTFVTQLDFHTTLRKLQNIATFELSFHGKPCSWETFTLDLRCALADLFLLRSLKYLYLRNLHLPTIAAQWITCVPVLHLAKVHFIDYEDEYVLGKPPGRRADICHPRTLSVHLQNPFMTKPVIDILSSQKCKLETLILLTVTPDDVAIAKQIMQGSYTSLTTHLWELDIGILSNLKTIILKTFSMTGADTCVENMHPFLSTARNGNTIQEINVNIIEFGLHLINTNGEHWESLDSLLSGPLFKKLQKLVIDASDERIVKGRRKHTSLVTKFKLCVRNRLHKTHEMGLLQLSI
ncbi:hypothetical protein BDQ17DRAFT_1367537 [Cyathus striatus]|nr:hypothetical protein BDQ17DRAFT_1367537 [Cyathus striatus]